MLPSLAIQNLEPRIDVNNDRAPLRSPVLPDNAHIWITLVVLIPIIFTIILCVITACIYRYKKKRAQRNMTSIDQHNATMFHGSQGNPFVIEDLPPSYDLISETKKDLSFNTETMNTYERFNLSPIKNEMAMNTPPLPPYTSILIDSTKPF